MTKLLTGSLLLAATLVFAGCGSAEVAKEDAVEEKTEVVATQETSEVVELIEVIIDGESQMMTKDQADATINQLGEAYGVRYEEGKLYLERLEVVEEAQEATVDTEQRDYVLEMLDWNSGQYLQTSIDLSDGYVDDAHHLTTLSEDEIYAAIGDRELAPDQVELISNYVLAQNELAEGMTENNYAVTDPEDILAAQEVLDNMVFASWELFEIVEGN